MNRLLAMWSGAAPSDAKGALARKADMCASIFTEARRLIRNDQFGAPLNQLIFRACELLDDMDEALLVLHPARSGADFALAAALHRELEQIQAAIPAASRGRPTDSMVDRAG